MKKIGFLVLMLAMNGALCWASVVKHRFEKDLTDEKVGPMLWLIQALRKHGGSTRFILTFHAEGAKSTQSTKVNFDSKSHRLYLLEEDGGWSKTLTLYKNVDLKKIVQCYRLKEKYSLSGADNFEMLDMVGCPSSVLYRKVFSVNGPDK